ncbi:hypothetical protein MMC30_001565 [Trapelia coarctata]|nr:hypothetical protein [Trapelia coarctata]
MAMLDYYREPHHPPASPRELDLVALGLPDVQRLRESSSPSHTLGSGEEWQGLRSYKKFLEAIEDPDIANEELFQRYQDLPFPGVSHISEGFRRRLLHRLSVSEKRTESATLRYLSVVDDMKAAGLPLEPSEWSSAIHLIGRCYSKVSDVEVEAALRIWKEMEQEASVKGTSVTFNILFDIAVKAGKFSLAEMILKEMKVRNLSLRRFAYVGLIYYHGLKGDGDGIREAYRHLVDNGQIVDTAVLNCVIVSLLRADEPDAAEQVYERMKLMHARRGGRKLPPNGWKQSRELGQLLERAARMLKSTEEKTKLQDEQSLAPDRRTFAILLAHHISHTGELQRVATLLDEMQLLGIALHGRLFMEIFRGFANHGGIRYSPWTSARLESVWTALQNTLAKDVEGVYISKWVAIWVVRAFARCSGRGRALEIWDELKSRWKPTEQEQAMMSGILETAVRDKARDPLGTFR